MRRFVTAALLALSLTAGGAVSVPAPVHAQPEPVTVQAEEIQQTAYPKGCSGGITGKYYAGRCTYGTGSFMAVVRCRTYYNFYYNRYGKRINITPRDPSDFSIAGCTGLGENIISGYLSVSSTVFSEPLVVAPVTK